VSLTVNNFSDLLQIIETHPEWRRKLVKVLFPEIDLPKAFQDLASTGQRTEAALERLAKSHERLDKSAEICLERD